MKTGSDKLGINVGVISTNNLHTFIDTYYSILSQLLKKEEYFKFQYMEMKNKNKVDLIDQDGLNSDPNFQ